MQSHVSIVELGLVSFLSMSYDRCLKSVFASMFAISPNTPPGLRRLDTCSLFCRLYSPLCGQPIFVVGDCFESIVSSMQSG
jgi:hypothetical protein